MVGEVVFHVAGLHVLMDELRQHVPNLTLDLRVLVRDHLLGLVNHSRHIVHSLVKRFKALPHELGRTHAFLFINELVSSLHLIVVTQTAHRSGYQRGTL